MVCSRKTNFPNCFGHYIDCIRSVLGYHISVSPVSNFFPKHRKHHELRSDLKIGIERGFY